MKLQATGIQGLPAAPEAEGKENLPQGLRGGGQGMGAGPANTSMGWWTAGLQKGR